MGIVQCLILVLVIFWHCWSHGDLKQGPLLRIKWLTLDFDPVGNKDCGGISLYICLVVLEEHAGEAW